MYSSYSRRSGGSIWPADAPPSPTLAATTYSAPTLLHLACGALLAVLVAPLYLTGVSLPAPWPMVRLSLYTAVMCSALLAAGLPDVLLSSGALPCVLAVALEAVYIFTFPTRMIFNDPRGKGRYKAAFEAYAEDQILNR